MKFAALFLALALGLAAATEFKQEQIDTVTNLLTKIKADIADERLRDTELVNTKKNLEKSAEESMTASEAIWRASVDDMEKAAQYLKDNEARLQQMEQAYAEDQAVRDTEKTSAVKIDETATEITSVGGTGTLGELAPVPLTDIELKRTSSDLGTVDQTADTITTSVTQEQTSDEQRIEEQKTIVAAAKTDFENKQASTVASRNILTQDISSYNTSVAVREHTEKEYAKSEAVRVSDEALVATVSTKMTELVAIRGKEAAAALLSELEVSRSSDSGTLIIGKLDEMKNDVKTEDDQAKMLKDMMIQTEAVKRAARDASLTAYNLAKSVTADKMQKMQTAEAAYKEAEKSLATERATQAKENVMLQQFLDTLRQMKSTELVSGKCPVAANGKMCAGSGACVDDVCKCYYGHEGADCAACTAGFAMKDGVCTSTRTAVTAFLQYSEADASTMLLQARRSVTQMSQVETLLAEVQAEMAQTVASLAAVSKKKKEEYATATTEYQTAVAAEAAAKTDYETKLGAWNTAKAQMDMIVAMWEREHPLRVSEMTSIDEIKTIVNQIIASQSYKITEYTAPTTAA